MRAPAGINYYYYYFIIFFLKAKGDWRRPIRRPPMSPMPEAGPGYKDNDLKDNIWQSITDQFGYANGE